MTCYNFIESGDLWNSIESFVKPRMSSEIALAMVVPRSKPYYLEI